MELGRIEREIFVEASPDIVFEVVSRPEHVRQWWPDDADYELIPGQNGHIVFGVDDAATVESFTVVDSQPPRTFSFRWTHPAGETASAGNSMLVTFELAPVGDGTRVRMTETGFRERGWENAVVEEQYRAHEFGWDFYLPRLAPYVESMRARS